MLATIAMLILIMGLAVSVSYNIMNLNQSNTDLINSQRNILFIDNWKSKIINYSKAIGENGEYILPYGVNKTDYHTVPDWILGTTNNPYGNEIIYCPYAPINTGTLSDTINITDSLNYNVRKINNFATNVEGVSRDYIISSETPAHNVLGFLISPLNYSDALPNCSQITFNIENNVYTVSNGVVREITKEEVTLFNQTKNLTKNNLVYFENTIEGDSSLTGNTLQANLEYIINSNIPKAKLTLPSGTHEIGNIDFSSINASENKFEIILEGAGNSSTYISSNLTSSELTFNNYNIELLNLELSNDIQFTINDSKLNIKNSNISNLSSNNSYIIMDNGDVLSSALNSEAIYLYNSKLKFINSSSTINQNAGNNYAINSIKSNITIEGVLVNIINSSAGSNISLDNSTFTNYGSLNISSNVSHSSNMIIKEDSYYKNEGSATNLSGESTYGVINYGKISLNGSSIVNNSSNNTTLISLEGGSELLMKNSSVLGKLSTLNRPTNAIIDNGAKFINGSGVNVYANSSCWSGDIFTETEVTPSNIGKNGSTSDTNNTTYRMFNRSNWSCVI